MANKNNRSLYDIFMDMSVNYAEWARQVDAMIPRKVKSQTQEEPNLFNQPFAEEKKLEETFHADETAPRTERGWCKHKPQYIRRSTAAKICGVTTKVFDAVYASKGFEAPFIPEGFLGCALYIKRADFETILKLFVK